MSFSRPCLTTKRYGLTLVELLVAMAVFALMSGLALALLFQHQAASRQITEHTDVTTQLMLLYEKFGSELKHSRVLGLDADGRLEYWKVRMENGMPSLKASGMPEWLPGEPADPATATLGLDGEFLIRHFEGRNQSLMNMGTDAKLAFLWSPGSHLLTVLGAVGKHEGPGETAYREFRYDFYTTNNE